MFYRVCQLGACVVKFISIYYCKTEGSWRLLLPFCEGNRILYPTFRQYPPLGWIIFIQQHFLLANKGRRVFNTTYLPKPYSSASIGAPKLICNTCPFTTNAGTDFTPKPFASATRCWASPKCTTSTYSQPFQLSKTGRRYRL